MKDIQHTQSYCNDIKTTVILCTTLVRASILTKNEVLLEQTILLSCVVHRGKRIQYIQFKSKNTKLTFHIFSKILIKLNFLYAYAKKGIYELYQKYLKLLNLFPSCVIINYCLGCLCKRGKIE